jgi:DNA mismatch endonuclease (patch repair protein)
MARVGTRDTSAELKLRRALHANGLRFRVDRPVLADRRRRVDIVFGPARVAVFVDGCFWHGCPEHETQPKSNASFWREKLEANRQRDRDTDERLCNAGWAVVRVWEHEDADAAADRIQRLVHERQSKSSTPSSE